MTITPISVSSMFVDPRGMLNPVSGKLISSVQTALAGEWSTQNWQGNDGFSVAPSGSYFISLQGSTMVCNFALGDVTLSGNTITLPMDCVKSFLTVAAAGLDSCIFAYVNDKMVTLPDGVFSDMRITGSLILKQV